MTIVAPAATVRVGSPPVSRPLSVPLAQSRPSSTVRWPPPVSQAVPERRRAPTARASVTLAWPAATTAVSASAGTPAGVQVVGAARAPLGASAVGRSGGAGGPGRAGGPGGPGGAGVVDAGLPRGDDGGVGLGRAAGRRPVVGVVPGPVAAAPGVADLRGGGGGEEREEGEGREGVAGQHGCEGG